MKEVVEQYISILGKSFDIIGSSNDPKTFLWRTLLSTLPILEISSTIYGCNQTQFSKVISSCLAVDSISSWRCGLAIKYDVKYKKLQNPIEQTSKFMCQLILTSHKRKRV